MANSSSCRPHSKFLSGMKTRTAGTTINNATEITASNTAASQYGGITTKRCGTYRDFNTTKQDQQHGQINKQRDQHNQNGASHKIKFNDHSTRLYKRTLPRRQQFNGSWHCTIMTRNLMKIWMTSTIGTSITTKCYTRTTVTKSQI